MDFHHQSPYVVNMAYSQMYNAGRMWSDESLSDNAYDGRSVDDQRAIRKGMATPSLDIFKNEWKDPVSYTHLRAHETRHDLVCRLLLEKKKKKINKKKNKR